VLRQLLHLHGEPVVLSSRAFDLAVIGSEQNRYSAPAGYGRALTIAIDTGAQRGWPSQPAAERVIMAACRSSA